MGEEAFELGLLMGTESDPREEEQCTMFSFHHFLLQQFAAAKYVVTLDKVQFSCCYFIFRCRLLCQTLKCVLETSLSYNSRNNKVRLTF